MKIKKKNNINPIFFAFIVMLLWGSLYPTVKLGYTLFQIDTSYYPNLLIFAGLRFTVSGASISLFLGVKNKAIPTVKTKKEWGGIALVGLFAVILNYGCAFYGLSLVESSKTALLKQSGVLIFIVLCALLFKDDKMTIGKGIGAVLGLGSILILNINQLEFSMGLGEIIIIVSSFCTVTASAICKKLLKTTDSIMMTGYSQLLGGVVLLGIGLALGGSIKLKEFGDFALFGYIIAATCVSYIIWYTIIKICELSKLFIIKLSEPLFAAILSAILLRENLWQLHYLFAFLCIALAVVISNVKRSDKKRGEEPQEKNEKAETLSYNTFSYVNTLGTKLFTVICLPNATDKFPTVILRSPYVDYAENISEEDAVARVAEMQKSFVENGYAVVYQHCRGCGKSDGDCIPYVNEREDGLALQQWIREQPFYNGELYLCGGSYTATVHYATAPFADDIKGAVFNKQDCEYYNNTYRNGIFKMGFWNWYVNMYKKKSHAQRNCVMETYNILPFSDFTKTVFGENIPSFDEKLHHPDRNDAFWNTRNGGGERRNAIQNADIPILLTAGFYDISTGGIFDMWNALDETTKVKSAFIVHPYNHGVTPNSQPIQFDNATIEEKFGDYQVKWLNAIRMGEEPFVERGKITYYKLFGDTWCTDEFVQPKKQVTFTLGEGEKTYCYNPYAPAVFNGGLTAITGNAWQEPPNSRYDIISVFTPEFEEDTFIKGKMQAKLRVKSDCEDTCFYVRVSLVKEEGAYGLRDDINQISNFEASYTPNDRVDMEFTFEQHAFVVKKGEKLRVDISSSAFPLFVRHTNYKGLFCEQTTAKIAQNTVDLANSTLTIFVEQS